MSAFVVSESVINAEIVWVMKMNTSSFSFNSSKDIKEVFVVMFPGNEVAEKNDPFSLQSSLYRNFRRSAIFS